MHNDQKKSFVKWEIVDSNRDNVKDDGITTPHEDKLAEPNWSNTPPLDISLGDIDQVKEITLRISVQRYRKIQIPKL